MEHALRVLCDDEIVQAEWAKADQFHGAAGPSAHDRPVRALSDVVLNHFNGYDQQLCVCDAVEGDESFCSKLMREQSPHVGNATVFVSWALTSEVDSLLLVLETYLQESGLDPDTTFFWVGRRLIRKAQHTPLVPLPTSSIRPRSYPYA